MNWKLLRSLKLVGCTTGRSAQRLKGSSYSLADGVLAKDTALRCRLFAPKRRLSLRGGFFCCRLLDGQSLGLEGLQQGSQVLPFPAVLRLMRWHWRGGRILLFLDKHLNIGHIVPSAACHWRVP